MQMHAEEDDPTTIPVHSFHHKTLSDLTCDRLSCKYVYVANMHGYIYGINDIHNEMENWYEVEPHPHVRHWHSIHMRSSATEVIAFSHAMAEMMTPPSQAPSSSSPTSSSSTRKTASTTSHGTPPFMVRTWNNGLSWNITSINSPNGEVAMIDVRSSAVSKGTSKLVAITTVEVSAASLNEMSRSAIHQQENHKTENIANAYLHISSSFGNTWQITQSPVAWTSLAIEEGNLQHTILSEIRNEWTILASEELIGLHYSHDLGHTWHPASIIRQNGNVDVNKDNSSFGIHATKIFMDISGKYCTAIVYNGSVYRSEDRGVSWIEIVYPRGAWVEIDGTDDGRIQYILSSGAISNLEGGSNSTILADRGLHRSLDFGRSWTFVSDPFVGHVVNPQIGDGGDYEWHSLTIDGRTGNNIVLGSKFSRVFVSMDGGHAWRETPKERHPESMGIGGYIFYSVYAIALMYLIRKWGKKREQIIIAQSMARSNDRREQDSVDEIELPAFSLEETPAVAQATSIEGQVYTAVPCTDDVEDHSDVEDQSDVNNPMNIRRNNVYDDVL